MDKIFYAAVILIDLFISDESVSQTKDSLVAKTISENIILVQTKSGYSYLGQTPREMQQPLICLRGKDGIWGSPRKIEQIKYCLCPQVSHDGKYLFFMSWYRGDCVIYWVSKI